MLAFAVCVNTVVPALRPQVPIRDHAKTQPLNINDGTQEGQKPAGEAREEARTGSEAGGAAAVGFRVDNLMGSDESGIQVRAG